MSRLSLLWVLLLGLFTLVLLQLMLARVFRLFQVLLCRLLRCQTSIDIRLKERPLVAEGRVDGERILRPIPAKATCNLVYATD